MRRLNPEKLHVRFVEPTTNEGPVLPRCYTLTHSDRTGDLFLTVGPAHNVEQISGWYTRLMRDEVLAEWVQSDQSLELHVHCEVARGLGWTSMRESIFRRELDLVLEAIRFGDRVFFAKERNLDSARLVVHFRARSEQDDKIEDWGVPQDFA